MSGRRGCYGIGGRWSRRDAKEQTPAPSASTPGGQGGNEMVLGYDYDAKFHVLDRMVEALAARATNTAPPEAARSYYATTFASLAHAALVKANADAGLTPRRDGGRCIRLALQTNSDFPMLLENAFAKILLLAYEAAAPVYRQIASKVEIRNFQATSLLRPADFPAPLQLGEHAEFKTGWLSEGGESMTLSRFGSIGGISYEVLVNDDALAFAQIAQGAALRASDFEDEIFFARCFLSNSGLGPTLADALPVFDAGHANITGSGALDATRLAAARALLKKQTSSGGMKLNCDAAFLVTSPDSQTLAESLVAPLQPSSVNAAGGRITALADANLAGTRFYVIASPARLSSFVWGYLSGHEGPRVEVQPAFTHDGAEFKLSLNFGAGVADYRGAASGAGA